MENKGERNDRKRNGKVSDGTGASPADTERKIATFIRGESGIMLFTRRIVRYDYKGSLCAEKADPMVVTGGAHMTANERRLWQN